MADVVLSRCEQYDVDKIECLLYDALDRLGGVPALRPGARVLVKPNLLMKRGPEKHTTTHPAVVEALVRVLQQRGCAVIIADSPGGPISESILRGLYAATGMKGVAERTGAALCESTKSVQVEVSSPCLSHMLTVLKCAAESDLIVTVGKIKTHGLTKYTGAVKNLFGLIPGTLKVDYHARFPKIEDFCLGLMDVVSWANPCLSVLDGVWGMEGKGPSGGSPRKIGALVVSENPHAADVVGAGLIGFAPEEVPTLKAARERGLLPEVRVLKENLDALRVPDFRRAPAECERGILANPVFARAVRSRPIVKRDRCVGCGVCQRSCPAKAIALRGGVPAFDYKQCIRCYCCQELCPQTAVDVWQPFFMKWLR
jgi:uncharacterized protein (DUF362 family)/Pyruvate/2-oxoacid:ferredoxin oxidoreductase delta subunit